MVLGAFLWNGTELKSAGAKISWVNICCPKAEGGLGFRLLMDCNKASILRHLWALSSKADTLWVKWMHTYIIKHHCFWYMPPPPDASWNLGKIFKLRTLAKPLMKCTLSSSG